jgi:hypothetical protein
MRCAEQRWRAARGKQISIALMMPVAQSEIAQQRIVEAAPLHVVEERSHRLGIFLRACHHVQQHPTALDRKPPGRQNWFAFGARPQPLGDTIEKQDR